MLFVLQSIEIESNEIESIGIKIFSVVCVAFLSSCFLVLLVMRSVKKELVPCDDILAAFGSDKDEILQSGTGTRTQSPSPRDRDAADFFASGSVKKRSMAVFAPAALVSNFMSSGENALASVSANLLPLVRQAKDSNIVPKEHGSDSNNSLYDLAVVASPDHSKQGQAWEALTLSDLEAVDNLLCGEKIVMKIENAVYINLFTGHQSTGTLHMTNYKVFFTSNATRLAQSTESNKAESNVVIILPLSSIEKMEKFGNQQSAAQYCLTMYTKDLRVVRFGFNPTLQMRKRAYECLMQYVFPPKIEYVFAFYHKARLSIPREKDGWYLYDPVVEFARFGIPNAHYRLTRANAKYSLCSTYPDMFCIPSYISDSDLIKIAAFRSRGRLPVLCWKSASSNVALFRCAQPNVGINQARCAEDERLFAVISTITRVGSDVLIFDARPKLNAVGNQLAGKGYENTSYYTNCQIMFLNIDNIHVIRDAYYRMAKLIQRPNGLDYDDTWLSAVEGTEWLLHIRRILAGTTQMVTTLDRDKLSVVSHCSDGWDRTIQLITLTQLCMDSYYRTLKGFCILIEKEWLYYGHMFQERHGHTELNTHDQRAPIFQQWLDCVFQLIYQYPVAFQFTPRLLLAISEHLSSCRFGTFLYNSHQERIQADLSANTVSLWTYLLNSSQTDVYFINPLYDSESFENIVLYPSCSAKTIQVWSDFWFRSLTHEAICGSYSARVAQVDTSVSLETYQLKAIHKKLKNMQEEIELLKIENARLQGLGVVAPIAGACSMKREEKNFSTCKESKDDNVESTAVLLDDPSSLFATEEKEKVGIN